MLLYQNVRRSSQSSDRGYPQTCPQNSTCRIHFGCIIVGDGSMAFRAALALQRESLNARIIIFEGSRRRRTAAAWKGLSESSHRPGIGLINQRGQEKMGDQAPLPQLLSSDWLDPSGSWRYLRTVPLWRAINQGGGFTPPMARSRDPPRLDIRGEIVAQRR